MVSFQRADCGLVDVVGDVGHKVEQVAVARVHPSPGVGGQEWVFHWPDFGEWDGTDR